MKEGANFFSETLINFSDETKKNKGTEKSKKKITKKIIVNRVKSSVYNEIKNWLFQCSEGNDKLNSPFGGDGDIVNSFKGCAEDMVEGYQNIRNKNIGKDEIINIVKSDLGFNDLESEDAFKFSQDIAAEYWECFNTLLGKKMGKKFVEKFITSLKVEDQEKMLNGNFFYKKDRKLVVNPFYDVILNKGKKSKVSKLFRKLVKDFSEMKISDSDKVPDLGGFSKRFSYYLLNIFKNKSGKEEFSYRLECGLILDVLFDDEKNSKILKDMVKKRVKAIMADVVVGSKAEDFKLTKDCTIAEFCNKASGSKKGTGAVAFGVHLGSTFLDSGYNNLERVAVACHKSLSQENIKLGNTFSELTQDISDIMNFKKTSEDDYDIDIKTSTKKITDSKSEKMKNKTRRVRKLQNDHLKQVRKEINEDALIEKFKKFLNSKDEDETNEILGKITSESTEDLDLDLDLDFDDDSEENKLSEEEKKLLITKIKRGDFDKIFKK